MKDKIFVYSKLSIYKIIAELFNEYEIIRIYEQQITSVELTNKNILLVLEENLNFLNEQFFTKNNVIIFNAKTNNASTKKYPCSREINANINTKKFYDEVTTLFFSKFIFFRDVKIQNDKIININNGIAEYLTPLEQDICFVLFKNTQSKKNFLLEKVLKIKKDIETKTIETHLSRIRKKFLNISSAIEITTKEDTIYLK